MSRHVPLALAFALRALPGRPDGDHRADVVLLGDLVRVSAARLLDRLLRPVFHQPVVARGHRQQLRHRARLGRLHADGRAARRVRLRAPPVLRQERLQPADHGAGDRAGGGERARLLRLPEPAASGRHPQRHDRGAQRAVDPDRLPGADRDAQRLRPQPRARRHERRRRAAAHVLVRDAAGAAARHSSSARCSPSCTRSTRRWSRSSSPAATPRPCRRRCSNRSASNPIR